MTTDADLFRLLRATMRIIDRHAEVKTTSGALHIPASPLEAKELRGALEPFRSKYKDLESLSRRRVEEIAEGAPPTGDEQAIRAALYAALERT